MILPSHEYLDNKDIPYRTLELPESTAKGAAPVAQALGFRERQMVKTLIFESDRGERVLIMLGGDQSAKSGKLKKAIGSRNIKMASAETVKGVTGYEIGSIPPFHWQPPQFRTFLEASLLDEKELGVGTGKWGHEIIISPSDLVRASKATVVSLIPN